MLKLSSNCVVPLGGTAQESSIRRISTDFGCPKDRRATDYFLVKDSSATLPSDFAGYLFISRPPAGVPPNSFLLDQELSYLADGDVVRINPKRTALRTLYRRRSPKNALLVTERCNNYCLMCSQPPREIDDSYVAEDILRVIPLMAQETQEITLTGGEPTLLGHKLIEIILSLKKHLPQTAVHILSNGRLFSDWQCSQSIAHIHHPDLMIGIPIYSDISSIHDHVVQADGAFDETVRGVLNLKAVGVKVEIRVVLHRLTYERLPDLARFIRRNLIFCDHIALMGLEMTGFTRFNLDKLWIDPKDYQSHLREAVEILAIARMNVSIYNHQLCVLEPSLHKFSRKSISDWKNEYMEECLGCVRQNECGGFFSSAKLRYSKHIKPFI